MSLWRPLEDQRPNWLMGTGATRVEQGLVWTTAAAGTSSAVVVAVRADVEWERWQWLVVLALAVDLIGGPVANSLDSARRLYHRPLPAEASWTQRQVHNPIVFSAIHVQPFVAAALLPGDHWPWAATLYAATLAAVLTVRAVPPHLARPVAYAAAVLTILLQSLAAAPTGLTWLAPIFVMKLVLAHAAPRCVLSDFQASAGT